MRIAFLNSDYPSFLSAVYRRDPALAGRSYDQQMSVRNATFFGTADFMSRHFRTLGHEAIDIHVNNRPLQEAWMRDRGLGRGRVRLKSLAKQLLGRSPSQTLPYHEPLFWDILAAQLRAFSPDVVYNHDPGGISVARLKEISPKDCAMVTQIAAPRDPDTQWRLYDLVVSSLPNFVASFRREGCEAAYLPLSFETSLWNELQPGERDIPLSFVGSVTQAHRERAAFLEILARETKIAIWGDGVDSLPPDSAVRQRYCAPAWGRDMFVLLGRSSLTVNKHIDISENYANNMRLFEATGMGACLVTDWKENLDELFEAGREVVAYRSVEECLSLLRHYGAHDSERERIARAGQERCLRDHSYMRRMAQLAQMLTQRFA